MAESLHILLGTSACLQWLCHSGERTVARGPLVSSGSHHVHLSGTVLAILIESHLATFLCSLCVFNILAKFD